MADVIAQVPALLPLSFSLTPNSTNHVCHFFSRIIQRNRCQSADSWTLVGDEKPRVLLG
jgi:hypothetical protein